MNRYIRGFSGLFSSLPTYVILYVTAKCNARCKMCFYWKEIGNSADQTYKELSLEEIEKISKSLGFIQYLTLTGGEPILRKDLPSIARIFDKNNKVQFLSIPTNSILTDRTKTVVEEILKTTKNPYLKMCLSLDGLDSKHDEIRGVKGCFDKVVKNYENLSRLKRNVKDFEIMINMTVSRYNYKNVEEVMKFVRKNMPLAVFDFCWTRGDARNKDSKNITPDDYKMISSLVANTDENFSRGFSFAKIIAANKLASKDIIYQTIMGKKRTHECSAGQKMIIISENGTVKPCEILKADFGNLRDYNYDVAALLSGQKARKIINNINRKLCSCTFENAIQNSIITRPLNWPFLIKSLLKARK